MRSFQNSTQIFGLIYYFCQGAYIYTYMKPKKGLPHKWNLLAKKTFTFGFSSIIIKTNLHINLGMSSKFWEKFLGRKAETSLLWIFSSSFQFSDELFKFQYLQKIKYMITLIKPSNHLLIMQNKYPSKKTKRIEERPSFYPSWFW